MSLRVAITRVLPEAEATAERLRALGAEPVVAPLLKIEHRAFDQTIGGVQALVFTSANGVRAFSQASPFVMAPVFVVGDATAQAARDASFRDVQSADGDNATLVALVKSALDPKAGRVIHFSGAHVAGDIVSALSNAGFQAERRIAYEAVAVPELPAAYHSQLDLVLFHSTRAVEIFAGFGAPNAPDMKAACLSPAIAAAASVSPWKQVIVAPRPREDALLAAALA